MTDFFKGIPKITYEGPSSTNEFAFQHYNPDEVILGKRMEEHMRFAIAYWHSFAWPGGDPFGAPMTKLADKRVGIIGTGATAVQVVPEIAKVVKELYIFQRTPSTIDVRDQRATTQEEIDTWSKEPGWAKARRERLATISSGRTALQGNDDFLAGRVAHRFSCRLQRLQVVAAVVGKRGHRLFSAFA